MKKFFKDFKTFITKGNVLDLAVGMIIGAAFNAIVKSLVNDILMPVIGLAFQGDVSAQYFVLRGTPPTVDPTTGALIVPNGTVLMYWGQFLQNIIDFLIIGFTLFVIVRLIVKFQKIHETKKEQLLKKVASGQELTEDEKAEAEEVAPPVTEEVILLREIRDSLKSGVKPVKEEPVL